MWEKEDIEEMKDLKTQIKSQNLDIKEIKTNIEEQTEVYVDVSPDVNSLKKWILCMTHFKEVEINEVLRLEKSFPGTIEKGIETAKRDFMRSPHFDDFVYAAKLLAIEFLKDKLPAEQIQLLSPVSFNTMTIHWGNVKEYNRTNLLLLPTDIQDLFASYVYSGSEGDLNRLLEQARTAYSIFIAKLE